MQLGGSVVAGRVPATVCINGYFYLATVRINVYFEPNWGDVFSVAWWPAQDRPLH